MYRLANGRIWEKIPAITCTKVNRYKIPCMIREVWVRVVCKAAGIGAKCAVLYKLVVARIQAARVKIIL